MTRLSSKFICSLALVTVRSVQRNKSVVKLVPVHHTINVLTPSFPGLRVDPGHRGRRQRGEGGGTGLPGAEGRAGGRVDT